MNAEIRSIAENCTQAKPSVNELDLLKLLRYSKAFLTRIGSLRTSKNTKPRPIRTQTNFFNGVFSTAHLDLICCSPRFGPPDPGRRSTSKIIHIVRRWGRSDPQHRLQPRCARTSRKLAARFSGTRISPTAPPSPGSAMGCIA